MLEEIRGLPNGARFYKCDLHVHTPADRRFKWDGKSAETEEEKRILARQIVRYCRQQCNLDIVGITEHNDVSWLPYIQEEAEKASLIVFPGVELGSLAGQSMIHYLALFDPGTSADAIEHWLSHLGLVPGQRFHADNTPRVVQKLPQELLECICSGGGLKGIPIAAHASSSSGLFEDLRGEPRVLAYTDPRLLAVEIPMRRGDLPQFEKELVNGKHDIYKRKRVACLNNSDGRCLVPRPELPAIGSKYTYVKLSSPTIEGLRQAFVDFDSRIYLEGERQHERYPKVVGAAVEGGFLKSRDRASFRLHFNPNSNCIIGGRGTGKSALLEAIRYALEIPAKTDVNKDQAKELLSKTLRSGSKITVFYETDDGTTYRIERSWNEQPRVFDAVTGQEKIGLHPSRLISGGPIEVYGQKEVYEISKKPEFQLRLLDTYVYDVLKPVREKEADLLQKLGASSQEIVRLEKEAQAAEDKVEDLPGIREELGRLERQDAVTQFEKKKQLDREKTLLDQAGAEVEDLASKVGTFAADHAIPESLLNETTRKGLPHNDMLGRQRDLLDQVSTAFQSALNDLPSNLRSIWTTGERDRSDWKAEYMKETEACSAILREEPNASAERYLELVGRRDSLETLASDLQSLRKRIEGLKKNRHTQLLRLRRLRREDAFTIRSQKAQELNQLLGNAVKVDVVLEGNRQALIDQIWNNRPKSGVTQSVVGNLANAKDPSGNYYDPIDIVASIRYQQDNPSSKDSLLAKNFGISEAFCAKLAAIDDEWLYELETFSVPDLPVIKLRVGDKDKPLGELSVGQKCTAILSIILVERNAPLIIDQPEDDLDNRFIFDEIVTTLRREKERRQFIIATHNANIPVSGDAELIVVLDADDENGWVDCLGSIDDPSLREPVENILEGGREAFNIRKEKYGI